jgi:hypothetical protein
VVRRVHKSLPATVRADVKRVLLDAAVTLDPGDLQRVGRVLLIQVNTDPDGDDDHTKRANRALHLRDRDDGMTDLHAVLDPEGAAVVVAAIDHLPFPKMLLKTLTWCETPPHHLLES